MTGFTQSARGAAVKGAEGRDDRGQVSEFRRSLIGYFGRSGNSVNESVANGNDLRERLD